jgi:GNAT superfamily N-acetyltransferase
MLQPVSSDLLEQLLFAKLYFDYAGLFLAFDDDKPVGFAHAGFCANADQTWISTEAGVISAVVVRPDCNEAEVAAGLVEHCEDYLRRRGAKVFYGGGFGLTCPFYLGLYGGSELPGILDTDAVVRNVFATRSYREVERTAILHRDLNGFESVIDRRQMQIRRQMIVEVTIDAPTKTWWEACTIGEFDLTRFDLMPRTGGKPIATAMFRSLEPGGTTAICRAVGLIGLSVDPAFRRRGLAIFLLSEAFRQFIRLGIVQVEVQTQESDAVVLEVLQKLGLQQTGQGGVWRKTA